MMKGMSKTESTIEKKAFGNKISHIITLMIIQSILIGIKATIIGTVKIIIEEIKQVIMNTRMVATENNGIITDIIIKEAMNLVKTTITIIDTTKTAIIALIIVAQTGKMEIKLIKDTINTKMDTIAILI